jgi:hypothetical protein
MVTVHKKTKKKDFSINSVLFISLFLFVALFVPYVFKLQSGINLQNAMLLSKQKTEELKLNGVNPYPVQVKKIAQNTQWQANNFAYSLKNVYLADDIADIGNLRNKYNIGPKNAFFIAEVGVTDTRKSGDRREVDPVQAAKLRASGRDWTAINPKTTMLAPSESTNLFLIFPIAKTQSQVWVVAGNRLVTVDFASKDAVEMSGVFLTTQGYLPQYPQE